MVADNIGIHSSGTRYPRSISPCTAYHTIPPACGSSLPPWQQRPLRMAPRPPQIRSLHQKFHGIQSYSTKNQGHISKPCLDNSAELRHLRSRPPYLQNPFSGSRHCHHHPYPLIQDLEINCRATDLSHFSIRDLVFISIIEILTTHSPDEHIVACSCS